MEELLTPQICMDVDETPLDVGKGNSTDDETSSESGEPEMDDDEKVKLLFEEKFSGNAQTPEELTDFEKDAKKNVFAIGEPAVQFQRLHCTSCNIHLGSAPIGHFNRYIHPLLKVLLCKACYEFYCSGEFDKDEDGSEMYCRWCGQGGKVMCCAQCAYVFCQKCVRQNLGKRTLELIKDSDDWLCFGCNPTQLINLKIICTSLFEFVQEEIRLSKSLNNIERLKVDHAVCCQKIKANKRKRDDDITYTPHGNDWEESKPKKPNIIKSALTMPFVVTEDNAKANNWNQKEEAEVVCTPDLLSLMEEDPPPLTPMPKSAQVEQPSTTNSILSKELSKAPLNAKDMVPIQPKIIRPEGKKLYTIAPKANMMMICNTNTLQKTQPNFIRLQSPAIKFVPTITRPPIVNSIPAQITPGTKHDWYDKAATVVSTITGNLSVTLMNLTKEQRNAKSVEQLANIHNKLQELLSSSVNSLIQVRKNLRTEFLADLNKLKFSNPQTHASRNINNITTMPKPKPINSSNKENDDDDVIIINSESPPIKTAISEPPPLIKLSSLEAKSNSRPYLKVRSVSQLLTVSSECITIPDDPPNQADDVIAVEEKDPLELPPDAPEALMSKDRKKTDYPTVDDLKCNDEDAMKIKNALAESRIEELVRENIKYQVAEVSKDELKRMLSVRVLLATNFKEDLPDNRLKTDDSVVNINSVDPNENSENNEQGTNERSDMADSLESTKSLEPIQERPEQEKHVPESTESEKPIQESIENEEPSRESTEGDISEEAVSPKNTKENTESNQINGDETENVEASKVQNIRKEGEDKNHDEELRDNENNEFFSENSKLSSDSEMTTNKSKDETNSIKENALNASSANEEDINLTDEDASKLSASDLDSDVDNSNTENCLKSDKSSSEQIIKDSGVEVDSK